MRKPLLLLKSTIMNFEGHYKKHARLKPLLYYTTITCPNFSFVIFLYLEIFWPAWRHFLPLFKDLRCLPLQWSTILKLSIYILSIWTKVIDFRIYSKLSRYSPLIWLWDNRQVWVYNLFIVSNLYASKLL